MPRVSGGVSTAGGSSSSSDRLRGRGGQGEPRPGRDRGCRLRRAWTYRGRGRGGDRGGHQQRRRIPGGDRGAADRRGTESPGGGAPIGQPPPRRAVVGTVSGEGTQASAAPRGGP